jgi:hypothetical protein
MTDGLASVPFRMKNQASRCCLPITPSGCGFTVRLSLLQAHSRAAMRSRSGSPSWLKSRDSGQRCIDVSACRTAGYSAVTAADHLGRVSRDRSEIRAMPRTIGKDDFREKYG